MEHDKTPSNTSDRSFEEQLAASSLGTLGARMLITRTPVEQASRTLQRADDLEKLESAESEQ